MPAAARGTMLPAVFVVSEEAAATIRTAYEQEGELSAAIELRQLFPGVTDNAKARESRPDHRRVEDAACGPRPMSSVCALAVSGRAAS